MVFFPVAMDILYDAEGLLVAYDAPHACLLVEWLGHPDGPAKQAYCLTVLDLIKQTGAIRGVVNDLHDLDAWNEAVEWLGHVHQQELVAHGLVAIAWVLPQNLTARIHVEHVVDLFLHPVAQPPQQMLYNTFDDVEAAYSWLLYRTVPKGLLHAAGS